MLKTLRTKASGLFDPSKRILKKYQPVVEEVKKYVAEYESKSDDELRRIIANFRTELSELNNRIPDDDRSTIRMRRKTDTLNKAELDLYNKVQEIAPRAYAILNLITFRKVGMMRFDVQILAGLVLASGQKLVEMKTGEGKTLTFQLPLFLYGLTGRGAHLVTVNDYLAKRDGEYAGHIFSELGLTVGIITPEKSYKFIPDAELKEVRGAEAAAERAKFSEIKLSNMKGVNLQEVPKQEAYGCDVVVGTNNEFGFDYLRDNMVKNSRNRAQSELYFCIVDEADSILIDEARTPLIISAPAEESNDLYKTFATLAEQLSEDKDYVREEKERAVNLTDEGIAKVERLLGVENVWEDYRLAHHLENALKAKVYFRKDKEYLIRDKQVMIVDEFTGRVLAGRRYSEGLHQAIEAKEGVPIQQESRTLATITFQNFFRVYKILTGGSGTILTEQEEFFKIYNLDAVEIPTNLPMVRKDMPDRVYKNKEAKFKAVAAEIQRANETGQPILVGTTSISDSELLSGLLDEMKIEHEVLNAKFHEREAQIVAKAGGAHAVTVATNMAGRGTDIPLDEEAKAKGGLYVIGTERHESRRIDNQLRGRSGRQGDPGLSRFFVALDDQIMKMQGGDIVKRLMDMTNLPEDMPLESRMISGAIERAQKRMEGMYFDSRKHVVEYDDVVNQQREIFYTRRFRYLQLAEQFEQVYQIADSEKRSEAEAEAIQDLISEFKEVISSKAAELTAVAQDDELAAHHKRTSGENAALQLLSLGNDELFLAAANSSKLYKEDITYQTKLIEVLAQRISENKKQPELLNAFLTDFLRKTVELKINKIHNYPGLIRAIFLDVMDELWTLHLDYMQDVREGIGLRGIAQLDPLVEYKNEGFKAFTSFVGRINDQSLSALLQVEEAAIATQERGNVQIDQAQTNATQITDLLTGSREIESVEGDMSYNGGRLSRKQRREQERLSKKKKA